MPTKEVKTTFHNNESWWEVRINISEGKVSAMKQYSERFNNDKVFIDNEKELLILDGIVLNKFEIIDNNNLDSLVSFCRLLLKNQELARQLIGPFTIFVYDKIAHLGYAFCNQTGDTAVFYSQKHPNGDVIISNNFIRTNNFVDKTLDKYACHQLLTYGFIVDERTINENVKRLRAGKMLQITEKGVIVDIYHRFKYHCPQRISLTDAVEQLDVIYRKAVTRCFEKDLEYGYSHHLVDISAGLDSRMVNWVAKDLGYENIVNISYSQSQSSENKYATLLANHLGNEYYHRNLDDAGFLFDIEEIVLEEFGLAYYCGITGGYQFLKLLNFDHLGLEHTGQIGDVVIGSFLKSQDNIINIDAKRTSALLPLKKGLLDHVACECKSQEEFLMYSRAFQGALSTHYLRSHYTYAVSPFLDVELMEFCASLPVELRGGHKLYWDWLDRRYPKAGRIPSSRVRTSNQNLGGKIATLSGRVGGRLQRDFQKLKNKVGLSNRSAIANNMNPHDFWYQTNEQLRQFICNYYDEHISLLDAHKDLQADVRTLYFSPRCLDKLMAISLLATIKLFLK